MSGAEIDLFLKTFAVIGIFLIVGTVLRAKVPLLQKLYLPACVIGGVTALVLGPRMLGILPIPDSIMKTASNIPGRLFGILIASMPMCAAKMDRNELRGRTDAITLGLIITLIGALQFTLGFAVNLACRFFGYEVYEGFGTELFMGFCGGHGSAAAVGVNFEKLGQPYWEVAQGVAMTFATFGLIGGIVLGIAVINYTARRGLTHYVSDPNSLPEEMRVGLYKNREQRPVGGYLTTAGGSIDTLGLHLALIFTAVASGYFIYYLINKFKVPFLLYMTPWFWMLISMYIIWPVVRRLGCDRYFDRNMKSRISGAVTDFIVTAAIMSMPIAMIMEYWVPIAVTAVLGFLITVPGILYLDRKLIRKDWVEESMGPMGMMTGDFITGVLLIRMVDPDMKSESLNDFSIAYSLNTFYCVALSAMIYPYIVTRGIVSAAYFSAVQAVVLAAALVVFVKMTGGRKHAAE
ncbi:MAG: sodium/glutamate symporter [Pyramidobacter sp.]